MKNMPKKIIVVLGPTASGKTDLAVRLAKKFNGEIVSADSRQVYKGMNIGSGKVTKKEMRGISHYLLDVASPRQKFSVAQYRKLALKAIENIIKNNKLPIICGGTGFYIQAVVDGILIPKVKPDWKLRNKLEKKSTEKLFALFEKLDPERAKNIDRHNRRRLIRAIEIVVKTKKPVPAFKKDPLPYPVLLIGVKKRPEDLKTLIKRRLLKRFKTGMIGEVKKLRESGLSWKRLEDLGLEYRYIARYLQKKTTYAEMVQSLQKEIEHFAKRQITWFKRDKRIKWVASYKQAEKLAKNFIKRKTSW